MAHESSALMGHYVGGIMNQQFKVGQIVSVVGLKGELKVYPYTDYKERFKELEWLHLRDQIFYIEKVRYKEEMVILKLKGIDNRTTAEKYRNEYLIIDRENARELPEDTFFIADLVGIDVLTTEGSYIGKIADVIQNSSQDLYEVEMQNGKKFLIPAVEAFVDNIDIQEKKMTVTDIEGLIDL